MYLVSNFKPLEVRFACQQIENEKLVFDIVTSIEEKEKVLSLFQNEMKG